MLTLPLSKGRDNVAHASMAAALSVVPFGVGPRVRLANTSLAMAVAGQVQGTRASLGFLTLGDACANCMQCTRLLHANVSVPLYLVLPHLQQLCIQMLSTSARLFLTTFRGLPMANAES